MSSYADLVEGTRGMNCQKLLSRAQVHTLPKELFEKDSDSKKDNNTENSRYSTEFYHISVLLHAPSAESRLCITFQDAGEDPSNVDISLDSVFDEALWLTVVLSPPKIRNVIDCFLRIILKDHQ
jgi:hypothetical protein